MKDTFDVHAWNQKRYLAEGLSDRISKIYISYTEQGKLYSVKVEDADGKRLGKLHQDDTNELLKMLDIEDEIPYRMSSGDEAILDNIVKQLQDKGIDASWDDVMDVSEGNLLENEEDNFESDFKSLASSLASEIQDELEDKEEEINEVAGVVGILGYILLSNTVAHMLSGLAGKLSVKYKWGKGEAAARKIYDFTHKNEEAFKAPIKRVVGFFTKDDKKKKMITDVLFAIVILLMAGQAGGDAVTYIKKTGYLKGGLYGLKAAVKGTEVATILKGVVQDALS
tara:strand:- start:186 stop:1031 length:846 start_codon:yes stop_codon:yes gene_type:complete